VDAGKLFDSQKVSYPVHLVAIAANGACAVVHYMDGRDDHRALYLEEGNGWATSHPKLATGFASLRSGKRRFAKMSSRTDAYWQLHRSHVISLLMVWT
jgi:hypothetical protein